MLFASRTTAREDHARLAAIEARVVVARPVRAPAGSGGVTLPGSVQAVQEAQIYPRTSGYLRSLAVDLGDVVTARQALAAINNPEVDQELRQVQAAVGQARAAVQQARTQLTLARAAAARYGALVTRGYASEQETTGRRAQAEVAEANARRLQELKGYATLRAPFDGVITARSVEVGQRVTAGSASGQALLRVSKTDVVRVMVNVPQMYAPVPNADRALLAGMYAQLTLALEPAAPPLYVPATAMVASAEGTRMAVVEGGVIRWRAVQIDGDLGDRVAVATGLGEGDRVVVTPSDRLVEGMRVRAEMAVPAPAPSGR